MIDFTYKNHFRYGWNGQWLNAPPPGRAGFRIGYGNVTRPVGSFREECVRVAQLVAAAATEPLVVALSGGIDSEVIARSFIEAGAPFTAAIIAFSGDINKKDISYAFKFCKAHGIKYSVIEIDILKFWEQDIFKYSDPYGISSSHRPLMMHLVDQINGHLVIGGGDLRLKRDQGSDVVYFDQTHDSTTLQRFMIDRRRQGCPRFFVYTPEIMHAFLADPLIQGWVKCAKAMRMMTIKDFKPLVFERLWPEMQPRQKLHGFESLEPTDMKLRAELRTRAGYDSALDEICIRPSQMLAALSGPEPVIFHAPMKRDQRDELDGIN